MISRPTLKDVAEAAGVSAMTVSLSLRNSPRISQSTRDKVGKAATKLGYQVNPFAATLVSFRTSTNPKFQATLALLNCFHSPTEWRQYAAFTKFYEGAVDRASELGYSIEEFWVNDPSLTAERLRRTLSARGIPGIIMAFLEEGHQSVDKLHAFDFSGFACVTLGWRINDLNIHSASNDQFHAASLATQKLVDLGYQRIGLLLNEKTDEALEHRYRGGFLIHQMQFPASRRVPIFEASELTRKTFLNWVKKNRVDAVLAAPAGLHLWLEEDGYSIPKDIGFAYLERATPGGALAGIDQNDRLVGSAAVDVVVAHLHRNEYGISPFQKSTLIQGEWFEGWSVRKAGSPQIQSSPTSTGEKRVKSAAPKRQRSNA